MAGSPGCGSPPTRRRRAWGTTSTRPAAPGSGNSTAGAWPTPPDGWKVKKDGGRFDYLAGATITPRAVVKAVRKALEYFAAHRDELLAPTKPGGRTMSATDLAPPPPRRTRPTPADAPRRQGGLFSRKPGTSSSTACGSRTRASSRSWACAPCWPSATAWSTACPWAWPPPWSWPLASGSVALLRNFIPHEIRIPPSCWSSPCW
jgi:hypothetical protein